MGQSRDPASGRSGNTGSDWVNEPVSNSRWGRWPVPPLGAGGQDSATSAYSWDSSGTPCAAHS